MKTSRHPLRPIGLAVAVACGSLVAIAEPAPTLVLGTTITVSDASPADGAGTCDGTAPAVSCSNLRSAIAYANTNGNGGTAYDRIVLANGSVHTLTVARGGTETIGGGDVADPASLDVSGGDLDVTEALEIVTTDPTLARATIEGGTGFKDRLLHLNAIVKLDNLVLTKGNGEFMNGGAIYAEGTANTTINNSLVTGNQATWDGDFDDPLDPADTFTTEVQGSGGGIYTKGPLTITKSIFSSNTAKTLVGAADYEKNGNGGAIYSSQALTITDSTIGGEAAPNTAINGGGIQYSGGQALKIERSTLSHNEAVSGGALNVVSTATSVSIINSTISSNHVTDSGAGLNVNTDITLLNTTVANNVKDSSTKGSGLNQFSGTATLKNTLFANNTAFDSKGNVISVNCGKAGDGTPVIVSSGGNLSTDSSCSLTDGTDQVVADAKLGPLQANDSANGTFTHGLLAGSPAIDKGIKIGTDVPTIDQRDVARPLALANFAVDVGAYELEQADLRLAASAQRAAPGTSITFPVTVTNDGPHAASTVQLTVNVPTGMTVTTADTDCTVAGQTVTCSFAELAVGASEAVDITVGSTTEANYTVDATVSSDTAELSAANNAAAVSVSFDSGDGGGCSAATSERPVDPVLPLLAGLGLFGWALRRLRRR